jgi:Arc/MetJ family transcription regulator
MRTNVVLDDALVGEAMALTGLRTRRSVIDEALRELIRVRRKKDLGELAGQIQFADDYDPKAGWSRDHERG